jgi:hypothetical protein
MKLLLLAPVLLIGALVAGGCGGGDDGPKVIPTYTFEDVRDELVDRLDTIGTNIDAVPDDIKARIKTSCRNLETFIGEDNTNELCDTLDEGLDRADPGRIDRVLDELATLEP